MQHTLELKNLPCFSPKKEQHVRKEVNKGILIMIITRDQAKEREAI